MNTAFISSANLFPCSWDTLLSDWRSVLLPTSMIGTLKIKFGVFFINIRLFLYACYFSFLLTCYYLGDPLICREYSYILQNFEANQLNTLKHSHSRPQNIPEGILCTRLDRQCQLEISRMGDLLWWWSSWRLVKYKTGYFLVSTHAYVAKGARLIWISPVQ